MAIIDPITGLPLGVANGGLIQPINTTGIPTNDVPRTYRPGEQAALEAGVTYNMPQSSQVNQTMASAPPATYTPPNTPIATPSSSAKLDPLSVRASGPGVSLSSTQQRTTSTANPWQDFLANLVTNKVANTEVPEFTRNLLAQFSADPAMAAKSVPNIAAPLLASLRPQEQQETRNLSDIFRKAGVGSMQSGAFANEARRLVENQGNRAQQLVASNYVPLFGQTSQNISGAINSGLNFPQASLQGVGALTNLAGSFGPLAQTTETLKAGTEAAQAAPVNAPSWLMANNGAMKQQLGY